MLYLSLQGRQRTGLLRSTEVKTQQQCCALLLSWLSNTPLGATSSSPSGLQLRRRKNPLKVSSWNSLNSLFSTFALGSSTFFSTSFSLSSTLTPADVSSFA